MFKKEQMEFTASAGKHGFTLDEAYWAMTHPISVDPIEGEARDTTFAFVGRPHKTSLRMIEVFVARKPWGQVVIFHVMERPDLNID